VGPPVWSPLVLPLRIWNSILFTSLMSIFPQVLIVLSVADRCKDRMVSVLGTGVFVLSVSILELKSPEIITGKCLHEEISGSS